MRVHVHDLLEIATAAHVVIKTAKAMAKDHFVQELAQNLVPLKKNVQQKGKEQDLLLQEEEKEKMIEIRKMTEIMKEKEAKAVLDPQKGAVSLLQNLDQDPHVSVVGHDQEATPQEEEVAGRWIVGMMRMDIGYM